MRNGQLDLAGQALDDAARRFPDSPALVYDRSEIERRRGNIEASVAALQRLAALQPAQKGAWLRKIAQLYQDEDFDDQALAAAQKVIDAAPASADSAAFAARLAIQAQNFPLATADLQLAIRLSDRPNPYRIELARTLRRTSLVDEERDAFLAAFEAETDPLARLELVVSLADASARSGRLEELIALFRERRRTEKDGWRYAVYLAELFRKLPDEEGALRELAKATGPRSRDRLFLTEGWRISVGLQNASERARFARLLAETDPGVDREIELATALLRNGQTGEAMLRLQKNATALFADPLPWHDVLLPAAAAGQGEAVGKLLETGLARHADDWRLRFLLAEARLRTGDLAATDTLLRQVESATVPAAALPPTTLPDAEVDRSPEGGLSSGIAYSSGTGRSLGSEFARRNVHGFDIRQIVAQIAAGLKGVHAIAPASRGFPDYYGFQTEKYLPKTPVAAADAALLVRSILAQQQGRGDEFVAELQRSLKNQPRAERLARFSLVQALDPLLQEIAAEAASPSSDDAVRADCFEVLMSLTAELSPAWEAWRRKERPSFHSCAPSSNAKSGRKPWSSARSA
ncbi:MAG: hypothetical protein WDN28_12725 [Chthoniobacter sp.]